MKNALIIKTFLITLLFVSSCINKKRAESTIDFSLKKLSESTLSDVISNYSIIKLETNKSSKINRIRKVVIKNERIYLLNHQESKQEILIYSITGDYMNKISGIDDEENEFSGIVDFDIHPLTNHINLLDQKNEKVVVFAENTKYIESHNINYPAKEIVFGMKDGKVFTVFHAEYQEKNVDASNEIITFDENFLLTNTFFPFNTDFHPVRNNVRTLMKRNGQVMFLRAGTNHLYTIDMKERRENSNLIFPKPVLPANKTYDAFFRGDVDLAKYIYDVNYFESDTILFTTFSSAEGDYIGIYNKESGNSSLYNMLLDPECKCGVKIDIVGSLGNNFIVQIPRTKISNVIDVIDNNRKKCNNEEMVEIIDNMKPGENPILLLLEFKF